MRKHADLVNLKEPVHLVDQADALALLEQELPKLGLDHYLRLHEPLQELRHILKAISRAKDESSPLQNMKRRRSAWRRQRGPRKRP